MYSYNWVDAEIHELERKHMKCNELDNEKLVKIMIMLAGILLFLNGV